MLHVARRQVVAIVCVLCGIAAGVSISITNGIIYCDGLSCPTGSATCRVSSDSSADLRTITVQRQCKSSTGLVLAQKNTNDPNLAGETVHSVSESGAGGGGGGGGSSVSINHELPSRSMFGDAFDSPFFKRANKPNDRHYHRHHSHHVPSKSFFGDAFDTPFFKNALANEDEDNDEDDDDNEDEEDED